MQTVLQDVRYGIRMLLKKPGFALVAIFTLALGIAANTAIFSVVNTVLLKSLPFPESNQLVDLAETFKEVQACRKSGIMINTFMLADDYYLVEFVKQMTAMTNGKAYFATPGNLSQFVLIDFLKRKKSRVK